MAAGADARTLERGAGRTGASVRLEGCSRLLCVRRAVSPRARRSAARSTGGSAATKRARSSARRSAPRSLLRSRGRASRRLGASRVKRPVRVASVGGRRTSAQRTDAAT